MFNSEIAIDFGAKNIKISSINKGVIINEPAYIAVEKSSRQVLATGREAYQMIGRTGNKTYVDAPFAGGRIKSFSEAEFVLNKYIKRIDAGKMFLPAAAVSLPFGVTETERIAATNVIENAGIRKIAYIYEPLAVAIGAGMDVYSSEAFMVVDIGASKAYAAVIRNGKIIAYNETKSGGMSMDKAIIKYIRKKYDTEIGLLSAEELKHAIGCVAQREKVLYSHVKGKCLSTDLPKDNIVTSEDICLALSDEANNIINTVLTSLADISASNLGDIAIKGIHLTGGASLIFGIDSLIEKSSNIKTHTQTNAEEAVAIGAAEAIKIWNKDKDSTLFDIY